MTDDSLDSTEIRDTDIVFDCPFCGKSLAIDYRGAGLSIPCSDCGKSVEVPIPDGMEISDLDSSEEEQEIRILNLRRSLAEAEARIGELQSSVEELTIRREELEKHRTSNMSRSSTIAETVALMQEQIKQLSEGVKKIGDAIADGR